MFVFFVQHRRRPSQLEIVFIIIAIAIARIYKVVYGQQFTGQDRERWKGE